MSRRGLVIIGVFVVLGLATLSSAFYTVSETEQVIITQFGEPMGEAVTQAGLHVKIPFAQEANVFEKRWLEWNGNANQVPTRDKKYIGVETMHAGASPTPYCSSSGCATSAAPSRAWTTSSTEKPAT